VTATQGFIFAALVLALAGAVVDDERWVAPSWALAALCVIIGAVLWWGERAPI
jgi:hypothetical protein